MNKYRFEWDSNKAQINLQKHGVSFEEAMTVFYDESALEFFDSNRDIFYAKNNIIQIKRLDLVFAKIHISEVKQRL